MVEIDKNVIDPFGFIYITTNIVNGMKYIGQRMFKGKWKTYLGSGTNLLRSIKKYGRDNFYREIIAIAYSSEELNLLEIETIKNYGGINRSIYYNISFGGSAFMAGRKQTEETRKQMSKSSMGFVHSAESKKKISDAHKGMKQSEEAKKKLSSFRMGKPGTPHAEEYKKMMSETRKGIPKSEEHKRKMSISQRGKHATDETKAKMSLARRNENNFNYGNHYSDETRAKISKAHKGKIVSAESRKKMSESRRSITPQQIAEIREKSSQGASRRELKEEYSFSKSAIRDILLYERPYTREDIQQLASTV